MTVTELIEVLNGFPAGLTVYVMGGADCDMPSDPEPVLDMDSKIYPGVYL